MYFIIVGDLIKKYQDMLPKMCSPLHRMQHFLHCPDIYLRPEVIISDSNDVNFARQKKALNFFVNGKAACDMESMHQEFDNPNFGADLNRLALTNTNEITQPTL